ncbi:unnamed protein product, partial [Linum tenue]
KKTNIKAPKNAVGEVSSRWEFNSLPLFPGYKMQRHLPHFNHPSPFHSIHFLSFALLLFVFLLWVLVVKRFHYHG